MRLVVFIAVGVVGLINVVLVDQAASWDEIRVSGASGPLF